MDWCETNRVKISDFERRQMKALKDELDKEYEAQTGLNARTSKDRAERKLSSNSRT